MKTLIIAALLLLSVGSLDAQILNPLRSKDWDAIADLEYRDNGKGKMAPVYPPALKAIHNKVVTLPGYMVPIKAGITHTVIMLSVLPLEQCGFCGTGNLPIMVETFLTKALPYTDKPMKIQGKLFLNIAEERGKAEVSLMNARVIN